MQEILPIKKKIALYLETKGISKYRFYKESGITRGVLDHKSGITEDNLIRFLVFAQDISLNWLFFDKGDMLEEAKTTATIRVSDLGSRNTSTDDALYKEMLKEKDKEIASLNREIGRLLHAVDHLKKGGTVAGFGVEVRTKLDE